MVPALTGQATAIVDKALSTGARGQTTTTENNYGPLSDAFMQKASLDQNIAEMHSNAMISKANILSNIELSKADIHLKATEMKLGVMQYQDQVRREEEADKMSPFEQITGVLAGAAGGAQAGAAVGGKGGAIAGGVLGGLAAFNGGNKSRTRQQHVLGNIGTISSAAVNLRTIMDYNKGKDAEKTWQEGYTKLAEAVRNTAPGTPERAAAEANLDTHIQGLDKVMAAQNVPIQQRAETIAGYRKNALGVDPDDESYKYAQDMKGIVMRGRNNDALMDPGHKDHQTAKEGFYAELDRTHRQYTGKQLDKGGFGSYAEELAPGMGRTMLGGAAGTSSPLAQGHNRGGGGTQVQSDSGVRDAGTGVGGNPRSGTSTAASGFQGGQQGAPVPHTGTVRTGMSDGPQRSFGVMMDQQGPTEADILNKSIQMSKDPSLAAKALGRNELVDDENDTEGPVEDDRTVFQKVRDKSLDVGAKVLPGRRNSDVEGYVRDKFDLHKPEDKKKMDLQRKWDEASKKRYSDERVAGLQEMKQEIDNEAPAALNRMRKSPNLKAQEVSAKAEGALKDIDEAIRIAESELETFDSPKAQRGVSLRDGGQEIKVLGTSFGKFGEGTSMGMKGGEREAGAWDRVRSRFNSANRTTSRLDGATGDMSDKELAANQTLEPKPGKSRANVLEGLYEMKARIIDKMDAMSSQPLDLDTATKQSTHQKNLLDIQSKQIDLNDEFIIYTE